MTEKEALSFNLLPLTPIPDATTQVGSTTIQGVWRHRLSAGCPKEASLKTKVKAGAFIAVAGALAVAVPAAARPDGNHAGQRHATSRGLHFCDRVG
jgi:hypothetical protein